MVINSVFYQFGVLSIRCAINSVCYQFGERSICCSIKSLHFSVVFIKPVFNESGYRYFLKSILATVSEPRFLSARSVYQRSVYQRSVYQRSVYQRFVYQRSVYQRFVSALCIGAFYGQEL